MNNPALDLTATFGKYVGQVLLDPNRMSSDTLGETDMEMVIEKIRHDAAQHHLRVHIQYPDEMFAAEQRSDRLRVLVNHQAGVLKISGFKLG